MAGTAAHTQSMIACASATLSCWGAPSTEKRVVVRRVMVARTPDLEGREGVGESWVAVLGGCDVMG